MYYVRYSSKGVIGRFKIEYEKEDYLSIEEIELESARVDYLNHQCKMYNKIARRIDLGGFPDLCPTNYILPYYEFPLYMLAPYKKQEGVVDFPCGKLIGGNWSNLPRKDAPGYPKFNKVRDILAGNLNINNRDEDTRSTMKPVEVFKVFDIYFNPEGNHRLYVKRLMGEPTVRAEIYEVDYMWLLNNSILIERLYGDCIGLKKKDEEDGVYI